MAGVTIVRPITARVLRPASLVRWRLVPPQRAPRTVTDTAIRLAIRACASNRSGPATLINGSGSASAEERARAGAAGAVGTGCSIGCPSWDAPATTAVDRWLL